MEKYVPKKEIIQNPDGTVTEKVVMVLEEDKKKSEKPTS